MARHLRVFAAARPAVAQPSPFGDIPRRFAGLIEYAFVQTKMFKDWRAGLMHAGIFWGFVLLTIGTANIVTGGLIQSILSIPLDGALWAAISAMQNLVAVIVLVVDRLGVRAAADLEAAPPDVQPGRAAHPGDDRRRRRRPSCSPRSFQFARLRRRARRVRRRGARGAAARRVLAGDARGRVRRPVVGARRARRRVPRLPAVQQAPPHRDRVPEHLVSQARAARRAAGDGPRARGRDVRAEVAPGPRLEGPPRRLHLHRVRALPGGLPGERHREAAQSRRPSSWGSGRCRSRRSTAST